MGRHFSESEVSAMGRNRIEDKGLKQRLFQLREEKTMTYDNYAKERKVVRDHLKNNRRTSGNIEIDFDDREISEDVLKNVLLSRRPWSCTPSETTFNVIYRDASDPTLLKATYRLKDQGKRTISRRASAKSVPNGSRSLAVSRQSTRSEPPIEKSRLSSTSRISNASRLSASPGCKTVKPNSAHYKSWKLNENRKPNLITAAWTKKASSNSQLENRHLSGVSNSIILQVNDKEINENVESINLDTEEVVSVTSSGHNNSKTDGKEPIKNKTKKRLSIQEPNLSKVFESDTNSIIKNELTNIENENDFKSVSEIERNVLDTNQESVISIPQTEILVGLEQQQQLTGNTVDANSKTEQNSDQPEVKQILERQNSRPSTAALDFLDVNFLPSNLDDENCIYHRGKAIYNYVKPQHRYKHDPFASKSRERLVRKLTSDVPISFKEEKSTSVKLNRVYSKGARKRMLLQLIEENNSQRKGLCFNTDQGKLEDKINEFYESISKFCVSNSFS